MCVCVCVSVGCVKEKFATYEEFAVESLNGWNRYKNDFLFVVRACVVLATRYE